MHEHNRANDPTPRSLGTLSLEERLGKMDADLQEIKAAISGLPLRVRALEIVVYGGCGVALIGMIGALIALVLKTHLP